MNLLLTPAVSLTPEQRANLAASHRLFDLPDERVDLRTLTLDFDPALIEGIVCNFFFQANGLDALPNLRFIQLTSVGLDRVPVEQIRQRRIALHNAGSIYAVPMAEWAVGKILEMCKYSQFFYENQQNRIWNKHRGIRELAGMNALILGFGNVGRGIAKRLRAFDVKISAVDVVAPDASVVDAYYPMDDLDAALAQADIVVLCLPLTPETRGILNGQRLACMKQDAMLVNVARGALIDEAALLASLRSGHIAAAALDVFASEPLPPDSPLWTAPNLCLTPHNSFVGSGNAARLFQLIQHNLSHTGE